MALSPWPTSTAALATATATLKAAIRGPDDATTQRVGAVAAAMVEREAPDAPQAIKDEAVIRFAGYLRAADWGDVSKMSVGAAKPGHGDKPCTDVSQLRCQGAAGGLEGAPRGEPSADALALAET